MREVLYEESANPSNLKAQKAMYLIYSVFMWLSIFIGAIFFYLALFFNGFLILLALTVLSAVLFGVFRTKFFYCVDCIFVSGQTRIIKVVNYKKRKKIIIFDASEVVQVGKITSNSFERIWSTPNVKKIYGTPNKYAEEGFYVLVNQDGQQYLVILECKETYLSHLVSYTGRQVIEKDYKWYI